MTQYVTKEALAARLALAERDEESTPLGGTLRLRELTRAALRECAAYAATADAAEREKARGGALALAIGAAVTDETTDTEAVRRALTQFWLGAAEQATDGDRWHAALFAALVVDVETKAPIFDRADILHWPSRHELWDEVRRIVQAGLDLSEVGTGPLKSGDPETPAE